MDQKEHDGNLKEDRHHKNVQWGLLAQTGIDANIISWDLSEKNRLFFPGALAHQAFPNAKAGGDMFSLSKGIRPF